MAGILPPHFLESIRPLPPPEFHIPHQTLFDLESFGIHKNSFPRIVPMIVPIKTSNTLSRN
jgi:hypothetical protein